MINPKHVQVEKHPLQPFPDVTVFVGKVTFTVHHRVTNLLLEGNTAEEDQQAMTHRIEHVVRNAVWKETYGDLMDHISALIDVAKHCPPNYKGKLNKAVAELTSLLTIPSTTSDEQNDQP